MKRKTFLNITVVLVILIGIYTVCHFKFGKSSSDYYSPQIMAIHENGEKYVGSTSCLECHEDIFKSHTATAHFNSSAVANAHNIKGHFEDGANILDLKDVKFEMNLEAEFYYQHTVIKNRNILIPPSKFDIVIGSGMRGQSYLTWKKDQLFQLQASYYTPNDSWINSPGYPDYFLERPIRNACLQCHFTFVENTNSQKSQNQYIRETMIYGVDCERCHRPSERHVSFHKNNPEEKAPMYMLKIDSLSRKQRLDVCAQCHSGSRNNVLKGSSFSFLSGENLDEYSENTSVSNDSIPDVHGNQYGLLTRSECFKNSPAMDCTTCHDPHINQRGYTDYFNQKCISCHDAGSITCAVEKSEMSKMANNCIACHMPLMPSKAMKAQVSKDSLETSFYIRTHLIGIYP